MATQAELRAKAFTDRINATKAELAGVPVERFTREQINAAKATTDARLSSVPPQPNPRVLQTVPEPLASTGVPKSSFDAKLGLPNVRDFSKKLPRGTGIAAILAGSNVVNAAAEGGPKAALREAADSSAGFGGFVAGSKLAGRLTKALPSRFRGPVQLGAGILGGLGAGRLVRQFLPDEQSPEPATKLQSPFSVNPTVAQVNAGARQPDNQPANQQASDVLGTFTGSNRKTQTITRAKADELAAKLPTFSLAPGSDATTRLSNGNTAQFQAQRPSTSRIDSATRQIDATIAGLGELNMRSKRALVGQLLDAKARLASGQFNTEAGIGTNDASIAQRQASDILSADTSSTNARLGRARTVVGADGALRAFDPANPASLTPVTDAAGNPIFTPQKTAADPQAKFQNDALLKLLGNQLPGQGLNEKQIQEQLDAITRLSSGGGAGLQQVGTGIDPKTGKVVPIFRDANGNVGTK